MAYEDYIRENLNSLENLSRKDFLYLSEYTNNYFSEKYSEIQINELSQLLKLVGLDDFPDGFKSNEVIITLNLDSLCFKNSFNQLCFNEDGRLYITPILQEVSPEQFKKVANNIINANSKNTWKHKNYSLETYKQCNTYSFDDKCAVAIRNNEIINILNASGSEVNDLSLIVETVAQGGKLIECYASDFSYYVNAKFMPISVCKWDDNRAPKAWIRSNRLSQNTDEWKYIVDENLKYPRQDIIFMIYIGTDTNVTLNEWIKNVGYSDSYEQAKSTQIKVYKELEGINEYSG